jgi:HK97 family phage major capsid protein
MAEEAKKTEEQQPDNGAAKVVEAINKIDERIETIEGKQDGLQKEFEEAKKTQYPHGAPFVRKGEDIMSSRPYSLMRIAVALKKKKDGDDDWKFYAAQEMDLSQRLKKQYAERMGASLHNVVVPLGSDLMPTESREIVEKETGKEVTLPGLDVDIVKECRDVMSSSLASFDPDELSYLEKRHGLTQLRKDMSANTATTGGTLVGFAQQGELIDLLRGQEVFSQAGATEIDLPPQGNIRFPRITGGVTISSYAEATSITESTPATAHLLLQAKKYAGLVDVPDELLKFATSVAVETWLRGEFTKDIALQTDSDMIAGGGGIGIQGVTLYSGFRTVIASTTAAQGDTLEAEDPARLYADIADQNAPVEQGFFYAMTNTLWGGLSNRRADAISAADNQGAFVFNVGTQTVGGGRPRKSLNGELVICSTQVPTNRTKGAATTLTMLLGGVGREWVIARSGVIDFAMTESDASKFASGINTLRGQLFCDAGPRHEASFGMIDDLLNS